MERNLWDIEREVRVLRQDVAAVRLELDGVKSELDSALTLLKSQTETLATILSIVQHPPEPASVSLSFGSPVNQ